MHEPSTVLLLLLLFLVAADAADVGVAVSLSISYYCESWYCSHTDYHYWYHSQ